MLAFIDCHRCDVRPANVETAFYTTNTRSSRLTALRSDFPRDGREWDMGRICGGFAADAAPTGWRDLA